MATHTAKIEGVSTKSLRTVTLAHPLNARDMQRLALSDGSETGEVGDRVKVTPDHAATLINAGYAQVDPEDAAAVRAVLNPETVADDDESEETSTNARTADTQTPATGTAQATPSQSGKSST
jgi:hypothetical protein